jgi:hypothetical protein
MSVRFYKMTWLVFLAVVALTYLTGNLTPIVGVVFGFIVFGMVFMGMMSVLPAGITHPEPPATGPGFLRRVTGLLGRPIGAAQRSSRSWMPSGHVEVRQPKYH